MYVYHRLISGKKHQNVYLSQYKITSENGQRRPSTIIALLRIVLAFYFSVKRSENATSSRSTITDYHTYPEVTVPITVLPYSGPAAVVSHHSHDISVALASLLLKKNTSKGSRIYTFRGLKENLREEDNLSTRDNWPVPNVSFVRRFCCNKIVQWCEKF